MPAGYRRECQGPEARVSPHLPQAPEHHLNLKEWFCSLNFSKLKDRHSGQDILRLETQCHSPGTPKSHLFLKCILTEVDLLAFHSLLFPEPLTHKCETSLESIQWDSSAHDISWGHPHASKMGDSLGEIGRKHLASFTTWLVMEFFLSLPDFNVALILTSLQSREIKLGNGRRRATPSSTINFWWLPQSSNESAPPVIQDCFLLPFVFLLL